MAMPLHSRSLIVAALACLPACGTAQSDSPFGEGGSGGGTSPAADTDGSDEPGSGGADSSADSYEPTTGDGGGGDDSDTDGDSDSDTDDPSTGDPAECGDGFVEGAELCDDGDDDDYDGCASDCTPTMGVTAFSAGGAHTCAISFSGAARCWGDNRYGQLGYGSDVDATGIESTPYDDDEDIASNEPFVQISAGLEHTCAVADSGNVYCWGRNDDGQLGYGHGDHLGDDDGETPAAIGPVDLDEPAIAVSAGSDATCVVFEGGNAKCWGRGTFGELAQGGGFSGTIGAGNDPYQRPNQAPAIAFAAANGDRRVSAGTGHHLCATTPDGGVTCWGVGSFGQLGYGQASSVGIMSTPAMKGNVPFYTETPPAIEAVAVGARHTCAMDDAGSVYCWGYGTHGGLGYGDDEHIGDDEPVPATPVQFGGTATMVTVGERFSCVLTTVGDVVCWGAAEAGQIGRGSTTRIGDDESPNFSVGGSVAVALDATTVAIEAGHAHTCALSDEAQLRCWGHGGAGRLGNGAGEDNIGDDAEDVFAVTPVFGAAQ
jgi:cysteine-rich repeat protein